MWWVRFCKMKRVLETDGGEVFDADGLRSKMAGMVS